MGRPWIVPLALLLVVATVTALVAPWVMSGYWLRVFTTILMLAGLAQSVNFIAGLAGYADFGNILYFGLGAYVTGFAMQHAVPAPLATPRARCAARPSLSRSAVRSCACAVTTSPSRRSGCSRAPASW